MKKSELMALLEGINDDGNVADILKETDLYKSSLTLDNFKTLLTGDNDFKSFIDSEKDKHYQKAFSTWKANNLDKIVEAEVIKRQGKPETAEQKAIRELQEKLATMEKEKAKAEMISKFKDVLQEKKIPSKLMDFVLGADEEVTNANITLFEEAMKSYVDNGVNDRLGNSRHVPQKGQQITQEQIQEAELKKILGLQ